MNKVLLENGVLIYLCVIYACFLTSAAGLSLWDIYYNAHNLVFYKKKKKNVCWPLLFTNTANIQLFIGGRAQTEFTDLRK